MTLTLHLPPELERSLHEEARHAGVDPETLALEAVKSRLRRPPTVLPGAEAELLAKINEGFSEDFWQRYYELIEMRDAETLNEEEHRELIARTDEVERWNARRIRNLVELATLRGVSLDDLMESLGIRRPQHG